MTDTDYQKLRKAKTVRVTVSLPADMVDAVDRLGAANELSRAAVVRLLIRNGLAVNGLTLKGEPK